MAVTAETIESYFEQYEWSFDRVDETHFLTGFNSDVIDTFSIYITLAANWVYFTIAPFVPAPEDPRCETKLYAHLLRLCQQINMAKFAVDNDGDITLTVELPRENLDYSEFSDALSALSHYADMTYEGVLALATNPDAVSAFDQEDELDWGN